MELLFYRSRLNNKLDKTSGHSELRSVRCSCVFEFCFHSDPAQSPLHVGAAEPFEVIENNTVGIILVENVVQWSNLHCSHIVPGLIVPSSKKLKS